MRINISFFKTLQGIILILIIALLAITVFLAFLNSFSTANDQKRISDVDKIQAVLKVYRDANGYFPSGKDGKPSNIETYLDFWPTAPKADGSCSSAQNSYTYTQHSQGSDYSLSFCLGAKYKNITAGSHQATSGGIQ